MNNSIQENSYVSLSLTTPKLPKAKNRQQYTGAANYSTSPSFQGAASNAGKHFWLGLKKLSDAMKEVTEVTNALIAAFGTGIIAPAIILCSPGKGDKEDKDKKIFQAIRQPLSALLALGFQLPVTFMLNRLTDNLAYTEDSWLMKNKTINKYVHKFFDDDRLGTLIMDKKYLKKHASKEEIAAVENEFNSAESQLKKRLEEQIKKYYKEVGIDISDKELEKQVKKGKNKFILEEVASRKHSKLMEEKCKELATKNLKIESKDIVTADLKLLAEHNNKAALDAMEKDAKLSVFDVAAKWMGFETKNLKALKDKQDALKTEKGLEILKEKEPGIFENAELKLKKFVEARNGKSQKEFANKKFWITLFFNLFMVTASCFALNWAHPKFKVFLDKDKNAKEDNANKKVEVKA